MAEMNTDMSVDMAVDKDTAFWRRGLESAERQTAMMENLRVAVQWDQQLTKLDEVYCEVEAAKVAEIKRLSNCIVEEVKQVTRIQEDSVSNRKAEYLATGNNYQRFFITLLIALHTTIKANLWIFDFASRSNDVRELTEESVICLISEQGLRLAVKEWAHLFQSSLKLNLTMINKKIMPWLKRIAVSNGTSEEQGMWRCYFPLYSNSSHRILPKKDIVGVDLNTLIPLIKMEFESLRNGVGLLCNSVFDASISAAVYEPTGPLLDLNLARRLQLVSESAKTLSKLSEEDKEELLRVRKRRNYSGQNATAAKLEDPAFQMAAQMIRRAGGLEAASSSSSSAAASGRIQVLTFDPDFRGHYNYHWQRVEDSETAVYNPMVAPAVPETRAHKRKRNS